MKAEEIRKSAEIVDAACKTEAMEKLSGEDKLKAMATIVGAFGFSMFAEAAAQLAEANESLKCIAHPLIEVVNEEARPQDDVKTLRDEFAMAAITGIMATYSKIETLECAKEAYQIADAMLETRKK